MRKFALLIAGVMAASLLLAMPLIGCEGETGFTTASLSEATMCTGVDQYMRPLDETDVFTVDVPEIFCSVKLSQAPAFTEVKAVWIYIEGELEGVTNAAIAESELSSDGTRYLAFSLTRPDTGWERGDYKIVLYLNDQEEFSVPFTIE